MGEVLALDAPLEAAPRGQAAVEALSDARCTFHGSLAAGDAGETAVGESGTPQGASDGAARRTAASC